MTRIGRIGLVLGVVALVFGAIGSGVSLADPNPPPCGTDQTGLTTTGLGI